MHLFLYFIYFLFCKQEKSKKWEKREILIIQNSHLVYIYVNNQYYWHYSILNVTMLWFVLFNSLIKNDILHNELVFLHITTPIYYEYIIRLNREDTQRRRVFYFINLKDKTPLISLMYDLYDYTLTECSICHIYNCICYKNMYAEVVRGL